MLKREHLLKFLTLFLLIHSSRIDENNIGQKYDQNFDHLRQPNIRI